MKNKKKAVKNELVDVGTIAVMGNVVPDARLLQELTNLTVFRDKWQKILRLQDWDINIRFGSPHDVFKGSAVADIKVYPNSKRGLITVVHPSFLEEEREGESWYKDVENSVIHELLHLHTSPIRFEAEDAKELAEEQAINCLVSALLKLDRREKD